jgi:hypothetical protein
MEMNAMKLHGRVQAFAATQQKMFNELTEASDEAKPSPGRA